MAGMWNTTMVGAPVSDHFWVYGDYKENPKYNRLQNH